MIARHRQALVQAMPAMLAVWGGIAVAAAGGADYGWAITSSTPTFGARASEDARAQTAERGLSRAGRRSDHEADAWPPRRFV